MQESKVERCQWANVSVLDAQYHDTEWGVPVYDDQQIFEYLTLEGAQAGLSWSTILAKRENYRLAFDQFDIPTVADYGPDKIEELVVNAGIVRHRGKITATVNNARIVLEIQEEMGSFREYIWSFVEGAPRLNRWKSMAEVPSKTPEAEAMSKSLKKKGFKFVGPTICYAFMQATGMVNDHLTSCFRHPDYPGGR